MFNDNLTDHSGSALNEPVESELGCHSDGVSQLIVHCVTVEAKLVQLAHKESAIGQIMDG